VRLFRLLAVLSLCLTSLGQAWAQLTPEQQAAKERGLMLYNQYKEAVPDLRIAAEAGDREAQYFLAASLRLEKRYMTAEAHHWYEAAAQQGDYYAMIRLGRSGDDLCTVMNTRSTKTRRTVINGSQVTEHRYNEGDLPSDRLVAQKVDATLLTPKDRP
jgi:TPR repeat protein